MASAPGDPEVEFYVECVDDGEVSTFLADVVEVGDGLEVRGPIGGWFVWTADAPAFGIAGGTCFVCGSAAFAEAAAELLLGCGTAAGRIRVERFGPSG